MSVKIFLCICTFKCLTYTHTHTMKWLFWSPDTRIYFVQFGFWLFFDAGELVLDQMNLINIVIVIFFIFAHKGSIYLVMNIYCFIFKVDCKLLLSSRPCSRFAIAVNKTRLTLSPQASGVNLKQPIRRLPASDVTAIVFQIHLLEKRNN